MEHLDYLVTESNLKSKIPQQSLVNQFKSTLLCVIYYPYTYP
jgi:hypothetical protein